jgi:hypothetical protein
MILIIKNFYSYKYLAIYVTFRGSVIFTMGIKIIYGKQTVTKILNIKLH